MSTIGFYHMDLWHSSAAVPNLELIKIYSYFYNKGDQVIMMKPQDNIERFNCIYFFKDTQKPLGKEASLKLSVNRKELMGYGFFGKTEKLKPEIFNQPLNYSCYDAVSYKLSVKSKYNDIVKNSLVRIETEDYTDYKKDKNRIYICDNNLTSLPNAPDFLQEYKQHTFCPLFPVRLNKKNIETYVRYENLIQSQLALDVYDAELFKEYYMDKHISFGLGIFPNENEEHYIKRLLVIGLMFKNQKTIPNQRLWAPPRGKAESIYMWIMKKDWSSYMNFYKDDKEKQKEILNAPAGLRSLYKTNPLKITPSTFDLSTYF